MNCHSYRNTVTVRCRHQKALSPTLCDGQHKFARVAPSASVLGGKVAKRNHINPLSHDVLPTHIHAQCDAALRAQTKRSPQSSWPGLVVQQLHNVCQTAQP
jgi:hypothetical protein